jgi:hypothetical protein
VKAAARATFRTTRVGCETCVAAAVKGSVHHGLGYRVKRLPLTRHAERPGEVRGSRLEDSPGETPMV